jgi:transposase
MKPISNDLRKRIVEARQSRPRPTYEQVSKRFNVGPATVSRVLRDYRENSTWEYAVKPRKRKFVIDVDWLATHVEAHPHDRICDRMDAYEKQFGRRFASSTVSRALKYLGYTFKKRPFSPRNNTCPEFKPTAKNSKNE